MRLLHTETLRIISFIALDEDFDKSTVSRKQVLSHAWSESLKYLATRQNHPKMWLSDKQLGVYLRVVHCLGTYVGCNLNIGHLVKHEQVWESITSVKTLQEALDIIETENYGFDSNYLFSDATSLYFKGFNIFKYIYGEDWRRLVPIEGLNEVARVVSKTLAK